MSSDNHPKSVSGGETWIANAAHEMKTPITAMRGQIEEALRTGSVNAECERLLQSLLEEIHRLAAISDSVLLLSRADSGRCERDFKSMDLSTLVRESLEDAELLAAPAGIAVAPEITPGFRVRGDEQLLRSVLLNLFDNAVKYNREGGRIEVRLTAAEGTCRLAIANTGTGVCIEDAGRIFERFYRARRESGKLVPGHGLGLSICRELLRIHGGEIGLVQAGDAAYRPGWTEFRCEIPME